MTQTFLQEAHLPWMTYIELGCYNTDEAAFVAYEGIVYDITKFLSAHPGGKDLILTALGTDITDTLDSFHDIHVSRLLKSPEFREAHGINVVARLCEVSTKQYNRVGLYDYQSRRKYSTADPMWQELRREVFSLLRKQNLPIKKSLLECVVLLFVFYGTMSTCLYFGFIKGFWWACLLLGPVDTFTAV